MTLHNSLDQYFIFPPYIASATLQGACVAFGGQHSGLECSNRMSYKPHYEDVKQVSEYVEVNENPAYQSVDASEV